jgi:hypothetical protein
VEKFYKRKARKMEKKIYDILVECGTNERLDEILTKNKDYLALHQSLSQAEEEKERLLTRLRELDHTITDLYSEMIAFHTNMAYRQGLKDKDAILKEWDLFQK